MTSHHIVQVILIIQVADTTGVLQCGDIAMVEIVLLVKQHHGFGSGLIVVPTVINKLNMETYIVNIVQRNFRNPIAQLVVKNLKKQSEQFSAWYNGSFLLSRNIFSPIVVADNKVAKERFSRIEKVCIMLLENPNVDVEVIRKRVAMEFFLSMRVALDYVNYAKLVLREFYQHSQSQK